MDWLTFLSAVIQALAWPAAVVTTVVLLRGPLRKLVLLLRKLKFKELELDFDEKLEKAEAAGLPPAAPTTAPAVEGGSDSTERRLLIELAKTSPPAAIAEAWRQLENDIRSAFEVKGTRPPPGTAQLLEQAQRHGILLERVKGLVADLRELRNKAVHGRRQEVDLARAIEYIDLVERVRARLALRLVKDTGAAAGTVLVGAFPFSAGLRVRVHEAQEAGHGGRIFGAFDLLDAGTGKHAPFLGEFVGQTFLAAKELIERVGEQPGGEKCSHILNCNTLTCEPGESDAIPADK
jgi:hypothetical protein